MAKSVYVLFLLLLIIVVNGAESITIQTKDVWYSGNNKLIVNTNYNDFIVNIKSENDIILYSNNNLTQIENGYYYDNINIPNNLKKGNYFITVNAYDNGNIISKVKSIEIKDNTDSFIVKYLKQLYEWLFGYS